LPRHVPDFFSGLFGSNSKQWPASRSAFCPAASPMRADYVDYLTVIVTAG
jgi:hypothetical protein